MTGTYQRIILLQDSKATSLLSDVLSDMKYDLKNFTWDKFTVGAMDELWGDLIIADTNGTTDKAIELCHSLHERSSTKTIPVIIVSALPNIEDKENAFKAGCYDFVTKPFSLSEIIARIKNCLQNQKHLKMLEKSVDERTRQFKSSENRFKDIFSSLSQGGIIYEVADDETDFLISDFNPTAQRLDKIEKEKAVGRFFTELFEENDDFKLFEAIQRVWKTGIPEKIPAFLYRGTRNQGWREYDVFKLPSGEIITLFSDISEQKENEEKILKNKNFLQRIIDGVDDSLLVINRDHTIALANKAALQLGRHLQALSHTTTCHQLSHLSDFPCNGTNHPCPLQIVLKSKESVRVEHIHFDKNGYERIVNISCSPIFDEKGDVVQVIELSRDITKYKKQEQLKEITASLAQKARSCSLNELLQYLLDETEKLTGSKIGFFHFLQKDQTIVRFQARSTNTTNLFCKTERDEKYAFVDDVGVWADCIRQGRPVIHNDYQSLSNKKGLPKGHPTIIRELVVPIVHDDHVVAVLGVGNKAYDYGTHDVEMVVELAEVVREVMIRKQAEENLQTSEERFSKIFLSSPDAIILFRVNDGTILDVNPSFLGMFGYSRKFCVGRSIRELDLWVEDPVMKSTMATIKQGQPVKNIEVNGRRTSGEEFNVSASYDMLTIDQENCIIGMIRDISEKKIAERKNRTLEKQLHQSMKMEALGTLAGGIAHDFNNILSVIIGYTQLILSNLPENSDNYKKLLNVMQASDRAKNLVSQILAFSRNDEHVLRPVKTQLIVKEVLKLLRSSIPTTISIKQDIENSGGMVMADPTQIHQVIMNICTNAYQAMKENGGELEITLQETDPGPRELSVSHYLKSGPHVRIIIRDTGPGIPADALGRIFEPYYTTKPKGEGTGLGLAVVHGIVTNLKGDIFVKSDPGVGTAFSIFIPIVHGGSETDGSDIDLAVELKRGSEHILFVDDDEILVEVNKETLEDFGYNVTAVANSVEALNLFLNTPDAFDLIITDMTMPNLTGDKLAEKILKIRPGRPIILSTGYSDAINPEIAKTKGIMGYLNKPFVQKDLLSEIRKCLDNTESQDSE